MASQGRSSAGGKRPEPPPPGDGPRERRGAGAGEVAAPAQALGGGGALEVAARADPRGTGSREVAAPTTEPLRLALPKGRVLDEAIELFARAGIDLAVVRSQTRRLVHELPAADLTVYVVRDADVPTYVEHGAADAGVAGRDVLEEQERDLYEPLDLGIGRCRLAVAEPAGRPADDAQKLHLRIATKFPHLTRRHLEARGIVADVIKLHGSIELAPLTGLADRIVDLVSSGETLRQHHLVEVETVLEVSARLVVNRASLKLKTRALDALIGRLRQAVRPAGGR